MPNTCDHLLRCYVFVFSANIFDRVGLPDTDNLQQGALRHGLPPAGMHCLDPAMLYKAVGSFHL
jgi:hypothetical protein